MNTPLTSTAVMELLLDILPIIDEASTEELYKPAARRRYCEIAAIIRSANSGPQNPAATATAPHSPAPWHIVHAPGEVPAIYSGFRRICSRHPDRTESNPESDANDKLIAAAPDLLEALQLALKCADDHGADHFGYGEFADIASAAIAKATSA